MSARGDHTITASDGTNEDSATLTVFADVSLNPTAGNIGTELTVTGTGFSGVVTVQYDDTVVATTTADASGAFTVVFTAPASTGGNHTITASDNANTIQTTFVMESEAPPIPTPLLPEAGRKAEAGTYFDWGDVTDPSGVTYTLQIASDADFTTIVMQKEALTSSEYTIAKVEELPSTKKEAPYYWRVKAIDGASNKGAWSAPRSFYVGFSFALPDWVKYTLIGLGVLLVGLFGFWVGRRTAYSF